jgi:hypothetical protein
MSAETKAEIPWWRNHPWLGRHLFRERRDRYTYDELAPYIGQVIAWYPDGSGIADVAPDVETLQQRFAKRGEDCSFYVFESYPEPENLVGGIWEAEEWNPARGSQ